MFLNIFVATQSPVLVRDFVRSGVTFNQGRPSTCKLYIA